MSSGIKKNSGRGLASMIMLVTFIMLIPSGIMMHIYDIPGQSGGKHFAMGMHNVCALIFVVSGMFHLKYNFRVIIKYISEYRRELLITSCLTLIILVLSVMHAFH